MLVFCGYTDVLGYRARDEHWHVTELSYDGLTALRLAGSLLTGKAWDAPSQTWVDFLIDVRRGSRVGGVTR
jgi:hypothetical protein